MIIPTHERPREVRTLLESLDAPGMPELGRVIVVDDSVQSSLHPGEFPGLRLEVVRPDRRIFLAEARNLGLSRTEAEFVYVVDDDNRFVPGTVNFPLERIQSSPKIGAVMPSVLYARRPDLVWVYATPFRRGRWGFEQVGRNRTRDPAWEGRRLPTDALPNAALYRRDLVRALGGWDGRLPFCCSPAICQRIQASGYETCADSRAFSFHDTELPSEWGSWAQHATDPNRMRAQIHDWNFFLRELHGDSRKVRLETLVRTSPTNAILLASLTVARRGPIGPLLRAFVEGMYSGLTEPVEPAYRPAG